MSDDPKSRPVAMYGYPFVYRGGQIGNITAPASLTHGDVDRIAAMLHALVLDEET